MQCYCRWNILLLYLTKEIYKTSKILYQNTCKYWSVTHLASLYCGREGKYCMHTYTHLCTHKHTLTHIHIHSLTCAHCKTDAHTYTQTHPHTHTCIQTHSARLRCTSTPRNTMEKVMYSPVILQSYLLLYSL